MAKSSGIPIGSLLKLGGLAVGGYFGWQFIKEKVGGVSEETVGKAVISTNGAAVTCPSDAKVCPDGSSVSRIAPACTFAPCPTVTAPLKDRLLVAVKTSGYDPAAGYNVHQWNHFLGLVEPESVRTDLVEAGLADSGALIDVGQYLELRKSVNLSGLRGGYVMRGRY